MSFEFFGKLSNLSENINIQLLITTVFFMILGFIYYIYRLRRLIQPINFEENSNENINLNNNINNSKNKNNNININNNNNNNNKNNINSNSNNNINNENNNIRKFHIIIQIERERYQFDIKITDNIGQFVREKLYPLTNNREVYLLFQGQMLIQTQPFSFYEHRLSDNIVIICKVRENANPNNLNNNHYNDNIDERYQQQLRNDPRAVSIYSIYTHLFIIFILGFIIFSYKTFKEIFTKQTILMVQFLCIIWALSFSNMVTKLFFYKKISY